MKKILYVILCCLFVQTALSQKIKYKDLYPLLNAKKYDDAEPFLKQFLQDEKNVEKNPNASFQMALIYNEKALKDDILLETAEMQKHADSAIYFYQQSLKLIDDKEIRKNDEYYQAYKRRDIRTGKFGIKAGDVQFDIEEKIKRLKERKTKVINLAAFFYESKKAYDSVHASFLEVKEKYPTEKRLLLRLDDVTTSTFESMSSNYNKAVENFNSYKNLLSGIGNTDYGQSLVVKEISDYEKDGSTSTDMTKDNVEFWDYAKWTESVKGAHQDEVIPLFSKLISFDDNLNTLAQKIATDSVSVESQIPAIEAVSEFVKLKEFDSKPMPLALFRYKTADLKYNSLTMKNVNYRDSADVIYQLDILGKQVDIINALDSLASTMTEIDFEEESKNYESFVSTQYGSAAELKDYVSAQKSWTEEEKMKKENDLKILIEKSRWLVAENDSIPLFESEDHNAYLPVLQDSLITAGMHVEEDGKVKGYLANITRSRQQEVKVVFDLQADYFNKDNYDIIESKSLVLLTGKESIYFIMFYMPVPEQETFNATVVRANEEGLRWTNTVTLANSPGDLAYNIQTDEIIINYDIGDLEGVGGALVGAKLTLSKDGKVAN